ncbi:MAG: hypothetical protein UX10_C0026G0010 [Candidatus Magasanikbacteria bacterium GW2011_GWA2_45_39]|uniref:Glycosyltransferase RgtA/B/C/D-like domain-containing protein n=1 Tax=Candidatus Magasanikbacteria bacterium GW2011_GWA2_45_39 TaxID=1619041 RepID=A0A0G1MF35_9BACT|nr:MAG: hypothetical protein UX10_C0026G0010 [Candidatus Magasanikbacteria bacterium GW2011_GWA2_45_39]
MTPVHRLDTLKYWHQMMRWDGGWYERIARAGYEGQETAFFPLYPMATRAVSRIQNNFASAAGLISFLSFLGTLYFFIRLAERLFEKNTKTHESMASYNTADAASMHAAHAFSTRALFFFLFFPTAFYLLAPYTESLFLCFLLGSLYYAREKRVWLAGLLGFGAALTRVNGFFLVILLGYEMYTQWRAHETGAIWQKIMVAVSPLAGLATYMIYLKVRFGSFVQFAVSQARWDRNGSLNPFDIVNRLVVYFKEFGQLPSVFNAEFVSRMFDITFFVFIVAMGIWMWRTWRKDFALWTLSLVILPLLSGTLLSMPRYVFPSPFVAIFLARQIKNESVRLSILACFMALWTLLLVLFSNGYWVG